MGRLLVGLVCTLMVIGAADPKYFPMGTLGTTAQQHQFSADWYSKHLRILQEDSLWRLSQEQPTSETYRFLWLRTFHHPLCIRVSLHQDGTGVLVAKETNGQGGYEPGQVIRNTTRALSKEQGRRFLDRVHRVAFKRQSADNNESTIHLDGAQWIVEESKRGHYRVVDVWSPPPSHPVRLLAMTLMIEMAQWDVPSREVY